MSVVLRKNVSTLLVRVKNGNDVAALPLGTWPVGVAKVAAATSPGLSVAFCECPTRLQLIGSK